MGAEPFDGYAIGGSLGKNQAELLAVVAHTTPLLPAHKPNHLLGIGDINTLEKCIPFGVDTFDSSYPTKAARHGVLLTPEGPLKIMRHPFQQDFNPIDPKCPCHTCVNFSRAYLHHLFKAHEPIAQSLASLHNVAFMVQKMADLRQKILNNVL